MLRALPGPVILDEEAEEERHGAEALWELVQLARHSGLNEEAAFRERKQLINTEGGPTFPCGSMHDIMCMDLWHLQLLSSAGHVALHEGALLGFEYKYACD